jgi:Tfp pilus assembly protein FimV
MNVMRWYVSIVTVLFAGSVMAADMSVDQAVSRLLKDIKDVEVMKVPVPGAPQQGMNAGKQQLPATVKTGGTYQVRRGETLDMVIRKVAPNSPLQRSLLRQAFVKANPHAFRRNNPNWMYAGVVLKVPDIDDLRRVIFKDSPGSLKKNVSDEKAGWVRFP